ncbi:hypothetical protein WHR41_09140 [Cladosporium halotolerans]|uniref:Increased recombination centers protein 6 n=1 Tax=Cladosporium halotolerans TaxID=1052096 RepID=A0AB34KAC2_9PEZI
MEIKHPRRLLIFGPSSSGSLDLTEALTGSSPVPHASGSCAGLTHEWAIQNAYYSATVPVWIDEVVDLDEWKTEFMKEEAGEVVRAVGAWVYVFRLEKDGRVNDEVEKALSALQEVVEAHEGFGAESVMLAVGMSLPGGKGQAGKLGKEQSEAWEDLVMQYGFEFVEFAAEGTNELGEKQGVERVKEALEANEWGGGDAEREEGLDTLGLGEDDDPEVGDFGHEEAEMTAELFGLKAALLGQDDEEAEGYGEAMGADLSADNQKRQVEDLDRMMTKLLAIREQSADLPEAQRKRMAAQAVRDLMGEDSLV